MKFTFSAQGPKNTVSYVIFDRFAFFVMHASEAGHDNYRFMCNRARGTGTRV